MIHFGIMLNTWLMVARSVVFVHIHMPLKLPFQGSNGIYQERNAVIRLEAHDVSSKQAEAITGVLNDSLENVAHSFVSKAEMQKSEMIQDANLSKFKSEAQSSQEHHFSLLQHETEKLRGDIEKMRNELKYEIDMVTGGQCLDLTLERGCIQNAETTNKLDREIHALRAHLEAAMTHRFKELLSSSNLPSTSPKFISIKASTSSAFNSRENKQRDIGLLKKKKIWMSKIKRWTAGKEENLRALLSTLQYVL
ncbi:protein FMP [Salix suchowensis]|nr:protein FMP [Salix suchowensis]